MLKPDSMAATLLITALVALGPLSTDMYLPALPTLTREFGVGVDAIQLTLSVFLVGFAVSQLIYGPLADRYGRKPVLLVALGLFVVATIGCALAQSVEALIVWRFLQALAGCAGPVLGRAMVRDIHGPERSAQVLSYMGTAMSLAPALAPILGGVLLVAFGWGAIFYALALYGLLGAWSVAKALPETLEERDTTALRPRQMALNFAHLLGHRAYLGYALSCSSAFAGLFAFIAGSPFALIDYFAVREDHFGYYFGFMVLGYMSGTVISGRLSPRLAGRPLLLVGAGCTALSGMSMVGGWWLSPNLWAIIVPVTTYAAGVGIVMPQALAGALAPFPRTAGAASALFGFLQMTCAALGGVVVGQLHDGSPWSMIGVIAAAGLATWLATGLVRMTPDPRPDPQPPLDPVAPGDRTP